MLTPGVYEDPNFMGEAAWGECYTQHVVPKGGRNRQDLQQKYGNQEALAEGHVTTLMIKNLPRKLTEGGLMQELAPYIAQESYDFLYLPWDTMRSSNVGFAFLNCVDTHTARYLCEHLDGKPWRVTKSPKAVKIQPAHVQGIALNLVHYVGSAVATGGHVHVPMVFCRGQRIGFEEAVEKYVPPELLRKHKKDGASAAAGAAAAGWPDLADVSTLSSLGGFPRQGSVEVDGVQSASSATSAVEDGGSAVAGTAAARPVLAEMSARSFLGNSSTQGSAEGQSVAWQVEDYNASMATCLPEELNDVWNSESVQLRASDAYSVAWRKLNKQIQMLEATLDMQRGLLSRADAPCWAF